MNRPDYSHSIVNLMSSIAQGFGADGGPHSPLSELPPGQLAGGPVILLVLDGLGHELLSRFPDSFLARHQHARLTSVFPTTTASAITTFATAAAPQQHAVTGWFMWLRELGTVAVTLPFTHRCDGQSLRRSGIGPEQVMGAPPLTARLKNVGAHVVSPDYIVDSEYARATAGPARRHGYSGLAELVEQLARLARGRRYLYAYWPEIDTLSHRHGPQAPEVARHLAEVDRAVATLAQRLVGRGATLLVTADHGLIATGAQRLIDLAHHPRLADTLAAPLCGEPRAAFCYVRPRRERDFVAYIDGELAHCCELWPSEQLLEERLFGHGAPHPRLAERIGDYCLLMKDNYVVRDRLPGEQPFEHYGVHGGLSATELHVPLIILRP